MKTKEEIYIKIKELISNQNINKEDIVLNAELRNDLGLDSLDIVVLVVNLGKEYKIEITSNKLIDIRTFNDLLNHTYDTLAEKEMSVQPIEKVEKEESVGLIYAEEILNKVMSTATCNSLQPHQKICVLEVIKEAQRNAIEIALEMVFGSVEVIIEGKGSKIVRLSEYGKIHMDKHNGIRKELLNQIK